MAKRKYKSGSVREKIGRFYIRYYDMTGHQREEFGGATRSAAEKLLRQRVGEIAAGSPARKAGADVTVSDCLNLVLADYRLRKLDTAIPEARIKSVINPLIGHERAATINRKAIWAYISTRRADGRKDATINRELSLIRRGLKLAASDEYGMIPRAAQVPMLDEGDNVRTGFLRPDEYQRMYNALPDYLQPLFCVAYHTGLRRGTLLSLRLDQVDLDAGLIWVSRSQTKNRTSQTAPIIGDMRAHLARALSVNVRYVFERDGKPILSFKNAWNVARIEAKLPNLRFHDLRRTAVRDWVAAGADTSTAMAISGHKTFSMFQRYNILDAANIQRAAKLRDPQIELRGKQGKPVRAKPS